VGKGGRGLVLILRLSIVSATLRENRFLLALVSRKVAKENQSRKEKPKYATTVAVDHQSQPAPAIN